MSTPYKRILLKLSGNFFSGSEKNGLDFLVITAVADEILAAYKSGIEIAIVNGAGNIFRGRGRPKEFDRVTADRIGFMSGIPNSLALLEILNNKGVDTRIMCAFEIPGIARHFDPFKARKLLQEGKIVIFTGGTGEPFCTHDTAAVVRALEIKADVLLKATDVDGIYSEDPRKNPNAKKYDTISYSDAQEKHLEIMDQTAFALARDNTLNIIVFKWELGSLSRILKNPSFGTIVS